MATVTEIKTQLDQAISDVMNERKLVAQAKGVVQAALNDIARFEAAYEAAGKPFAEIDTLLATAPTSPLYRYLSELKNQVVSEKNALKVDAQAISAAIAATGK